MPWLIGRMLNVVYLLLLVAVSPMVLYRRCRHGKYRGGWREKLTGRLTRQHPSRPCLWFHAVSVGEVLQLQRLLDEMTTQLPEAELLISTTTDTGYDVARSRYPQHTVAYFPLDFTWATARALRSIRPDLVVMVELELWPNFLLECRRRGVPLALINGRIGEKSFRGYRKAVWLIRRVLSAFHVLAVQTPVYGSRLQQLGAPEERIVVTGNIKFDRVQTDRNNPRTRELRESFGLADEELVFVAGSTQGPEEEIAIRTWQTLRVEFPTLRLILVPRHKERFEEVAELVTHQGLSLIRRSRPGTLTMGNLPPVLLLDTLGELSDCWGLADLAFVGGSLTQRGGQNMLEPAGYGAAVLFGPNTWNFKDITAALLECDGAQVVRDEQDLLEAARQLLGNPEQRRRMGQQARDFVARQQGATSRTVACLTPLVNAHTTKERRVA